MQQRKKCKFGFSCAAMMLQPGLTANYCPNADTCGTLLDLSPEQEIDFYRIREIEGQPRRERIRINQQQAATLMLLTRGCPASPSSLGVIAALDNLQATLAFVRSHLNNYDATTYIAPTETETHTYNVKRPTGTYQYNKLASPTAIFEPSERTEKVKVIHLSHDDDPRNLEARSGIERRNKLLQLTVLLSHIEQSVEEVLATL